MELADVPRFVREIAGTLDHAVIEEATQLLLGFESGQGHGNDALGSNRVSRDLVANAVLEGHLVHLLHPTVEELIGAADPDDAGYDGDDRHQPTSGPTPARLSATQPVHITTRALSSFDNTDGTTKYVNVWKRVNSMRGASQRRGGIRRNPRSTRRKRSVHNVNTIEQTEYVIEPDHAVEVNKVGAGCVSIAQPRTSLSIVD